MHLIILGTNLESGKYYTSMHLFVKMFHDDRQSLLEIVRLPHATLLI
jgi:hypothetical protein